MTTPAPLPSTIVQFGTMAPWQALTVYALGVRVLNGAEIYQVNAQGTSGNAGGPVGVGVAIADPGSGDGLTWDSVVPLTAAWQATHAYLKGDVVTNDGGKVYTCIAAGTSAGAGGPTGAPTSPNVIADGTVAWSYTSTGIAQQTVPTSRVQDIGAVPGAPLFAQYLNAIFANLFAWVLYLRDLGSLDRTWTGVQTFANLTFFNVGAEFDGGLTAESASNSDTNAVIQTQHAPAHKKLIWQFKITSTIHGRFYADKDNTAFEATVNAAVDAAGTTWTTDDAASTAFRLRITKGSMLVEYHAAAASFAEGAWTAIGNFDGATGNLTITGGFQSATVTATAAGGVAASGGPVSASTKLSAGAARSSATVGAGQAVAAGEVWKDTGVFAWGKFRITAGPAVTFDRGANVASVVYSGAGVYTVTLQTAAANLLCPIVTAMDNGIGEVLIDSGVTSLLPPTTTVFRILYFAGGIPSDPTLLGGFFFNVMAG